MTTETKIKPVVKEIEKTRVAPNICSYTDDDHDNLFIEIELPGVNKKDINLKINEDSFYLTAPREDVTFVATLAFCCPVKADRAVAEDHDGLLKISIPFKDPLDDAVKIDIK